MIAKNGEGVFGLAHGARDPQYLLLFGSTINKVANEDYFSTRMAEDASKLRIA